MQQTHPDALYSSDTSYSMHRHGVGLGFEGRLAACQIAMNFEGKPEEYTFFSDFRSEADLVFRRYHWVAIFQKGKKEFGIVHGFFADPSIGQDRIEFIDVDAKIAAEGAPVTAAVYNISTCELFCAEQRALSLELGPKGDFYPLVCN